MRNSAARQFFLLLAILLIACVVYGSSQLPIDLSYTMKTLVREDEPAVSPDGKWVAYAVLSPPERSPGSEMTEEPRFLPNGTPSTYVGSKLFLVDGDGKQNISICPKKGSCWRPSWSQDSSKIAFYSDAEGIPQVWLYDVSARSSRKVSDAKIKAKLWMGDEAYWAVDSKKLYVPLAPASNKPKDEEKNGSVSENEQSGIHVYLSGKEIKEEDKKEPLVDYTEFFLSENNATLATIDVGSGKIQELVPAQIEPRPSCLTRSPSGKWIAYLSVYRIPNLTSAKAFYDLAIVPAGGGDVRIVAKDLEVNDNDYYSLAYRWRPSKDQLVYYKNSKLWFVDLDDPKLESKQIASNAAPFPILFTADGQRLLLGTKPVDRKDYSGFWPTALAALSLHDAATREFAFDPSLDFIQAIPAARNSLWAPAENRFLSVWRNRATGEKLIFSTDLNSGKTIPIRKEFGRFHFIGKAFANGSVFSTYEDAATPGNIYRFDQSLESKKRISNVEPRFENIRLGSVEFFQTELAQYDGKIVKIQTAVILPPGAKRGDRLPTLVFHYAGLPLSRDADRFLAGSPASVPISIFVTRGYAALLTDLVIGPEGAAGDPLDNMVDLLVPQIYHAAELGYTDIKRVGLIGQSYGGYSTVGIITKTNLFRAAVAIAGLYDLAADYAWMSHGITPHMNWAESGQGRMGTHPWGDLQRYIANSPYYRADKINTPLLLIHGGNDDASPVQDAEKMFVALKRLGKTAQLAVYDKEGHTIDHWSLAKAVDATERIVKFLSSYLQ